MNDIFVVLFSLIIAVCLIRFLTLVSKRLSLHTSIMRLGKNEGVEVRVLSSPIASLFSVSEMPSYAVRVGSGIYYVRLYNGIGAGKVVHFASREFTVRFSRLVTATYSRSRGGKRLRGFSRGVSVGSKVIIMPPLRIPEDHPEGCTPYPVMIFNPAPGEVSYVTEERTRIEVAFTGDEIYGARVFTKTTFLNFIDRLTRGAVFVPKDVYVFDDIYNK